MAPTFIQTNSASQNSVTSTSVAFGSNNGFDNFLVAVLRLPFGAGATYTVFDSQGNPWVNYINFAQSSDRYQLWYAPGCKTGANTVTAESVPQTSTFFRMIIAEYSGVTPQSQLVTDGQTSAIGDSTAVSSGGLLTTNASDLIIGFTSNQDADGGNGTFTVTGAGAPYTSGGGWNFRRQQDTNLNLYDMNVSSTGTYTFTGTDTGIVHWGAGIAAFKAGTSTDPYVGYGVNDSGGVALPGQEPTSTVWDTNQLTSLPAPLASGTRGPTNVGVIYQSGTGGQTPGYGQIFPSGRS